MAWLMQRGRRYEKISIDDRGGCGSGGNWLRKRYVNKRSIQESSGISAEFFTFNKLSSCPNGTHRANSAKQFGSKSKYAAPCAVSG
jgi:hypothetical protein